MGTGSSFVCEKCGCKYSVLTGVGFLQPTVYKETVQKIKAGKYGEDIKDIFLKTKYAAVGTEKDLFVCKCGYWTTDMNMDIYAPIDPDKLKELEYGPHIDEDSEEVTFAMREGLIKCFSVVRHWVHKCDRCGKEMKRIRDPENYAKRYGLNCPKCGTKNKSDHLGRIMWD